MTNTLSIQEPFSCLSHFTGALAGLVGTFYLFSTVSQNTPLITVCLIYGLSVIFLFSTSALYHAFKKEENSDSILRRLDHLAIFFMIAGTYTPVTYCYLPLNWFIFVMIVQWSLVVTGFFIIIFFMNAPRILSTGIYLAMGWFALVPVGKMLSTLPKTALFYLFAGAIAYTAGAIIYYLKKPDPVPGRFGFHEIFHIFILLGSVLHFIMVFVSIRSY